jgi:hypothetical protein
MNFRKIHLTYVFLFLGLSVFSILKIHFATIYDAPQRMDVNQYSAAVNCADNYNAKFQVLNKGYDKFGNIPKNIWAYWHELSSLPIFVRTILDSWRFHLPEYEIHVITKETIKNYTQTPFPKNFDSLKTAHQSDWLRYLLLVEHGGIWMDSSVLLADDLSFVERIRHEQEAEGFIFNSGPKKVENFFIAAVPKSDFMTAWFNEFDMMTECFSDHGPDYFYYITQKHPDLDFKMLRNDFDVGGLNYLRGYVAAQKVLQVDKVLPFALHQVDNFPLGPYWIVNKLGWQGSALFDYVSTPMDLARSPALIKLYREHRKLFIEKLSTATVSRGSFLEHFVFRPAALVRKLSSKTSY